MRGDLRSLIGADTHPFPELPASMTYPEVPTSPLKVCPHPSHSPFVPSRQAALEVRRNLGHPRKKRENQTKGPALSHPFLLCPVWGGIVSREKLVKLVGPNQAGKADTGITGGQAHYLHARFPRHPTGSICTCSALGVQSMHESRKGHGPLSSELQFRP